MLDVDPKYFFPSFLVISCSVASLDEVIYGFKVAKSNSLTGMIEAK